MQSFSEEALGFESAPGQVGVVIAPAGVGKTAFLVHLGIDIASRGEHVLHVALGSRVDQVQSWYDTLYGERFPDANDEARSDLHRRCVIQCLSPGVSLTTERLEEWVQLYQDHAFLHPHGIILDGFDWDGPAILRAAEIGALRSLARSRSAVVWMSASTHHP
ncbi:MAG: hypothetical protein HC923_00510 [Myxococcales bacterium]|nr:hypothetical protein [Myxococcales bacterium]